VSRSSGFESISRAQSWMQPMHYTCGLLALTSTFQTSQSCFMLRHVTSRYLLLHLHGQASTGLYASPGPPLGTPPPQLNCSTWNPRHDLASRRAMTLEAAVQQQHNTAAMQQQHNALHYQHPSERHSAVALQQQHNGAPPPSSASSSLPHPPTQHLRCLAACRARLTPCCRLRRSSGAVAARHRRAADGPQQMARSSLTAAPPPP
jgi:hypothetical protein